jgi:tripartite-type tricarboxylate transporter receptor subunit TctC
MNRIAAGLLALGMSLPMAAALAQTPGKPIRVIVPWPAGGTVDGVARVIGPSFSSGLGRTLIVENKAGAGGSIGQAEAAKAPADGNTVLLVFDTHAVNHLLYKNLGYDPFKSFEHVSLLVTSPQVLAGATNFAPSTVAELVAHAKTNPGKVTYATVGAGSSNHLNALLLANRTGIEMTHVPYKGGAPMMIDLVGGQVNVMFVSAPQAIPQAKAGRIKALAIGAVHRIPQLPDTPTVAETLPGFAAQSWVGMLVPAGTPKEIVGRLHAEAAKTLAGPEVRGKLAGQGFEVVGSTPEEFLAFARAESEKWAKVIRDYQIRVE